jgi:hypothetical protein
MMRFKKPSGPFTFIGWLGIFLVLGTSVYCQKKKLDPWVLNNAHIGPGSPLEVPAGGSYTARVEYPNPDGPTMRLPAKIGWSIEPAVEGIRIERDTGKITVDAGVASGTTAIVRADVNNGLRKLTGKLVVFSPAEDPLIGNWEVKSGLGCGADQQVLPAGAVDRLARHWSFHSDRTVWIGQPIGIAAGVKLSGTYEFDLKAGKLTLTPTWPKGRAAEEWRFELIRETEMKVVSARPQGDKGQVCGYVLSRNNRDN